MGVFIQRLIRWMPLILFVLLLMVDRDNVYQVGGYLILLFSYTGILILKILYAKEQWHKEFDGNALGRNSSIEKMSDFQKELNVENETHTES